MSLFRTLLVFVLAVLSLISGAAESPFQAIVLALLFVLCMDRPEASSDG